MSLDNIYKRLNMTRENGLCITKERHWRGLIPKRLEFLIKEKLEPTAFFCFDKKPLVLFYDSPSNKEKLFKDVWNFNETAVVIINEADSIEIYNGFSYSKDELALEKLADSDQLADFSYIELVTGKSLARYQTKLKQQNRVDSHLLENIRDARNILINDYKVEASLVNALIGKCIFVRYLIDRRVKIKFDGPLRKWTNKEFCKFFDNKARLIEFFEYLRSKFNGEAFLVNDYKLNSIPKDAFYVLKNLLMGTTLSSGQQSLFDIYDFSIIPVEFISNVYEHFIGKENQAQIGAYYTPKFLVDYILSETVEKYFKENPNQCDCKVLDPACGSGIFLVEALRRIIEHNNLTTKTKNLKTILRKLAETNIFGIDSDINAVNVAIFSIYLALLDYQDPKDIESFTFPNLIQNGNFHIKDFFNTKAKYNSHFGKIKFDFIVGNPPWKRGASQDNLFLQYITSRKQKESNKKYSGPECVISNTEIAQAFLLRTSDFSSEKTKCALIVTSKTLYNLNAIKFRKYFLYNFFIDKVFELAPVRKEIFDKSNDKAIAPAAILFFGYSHGDDTSSNELIHLCLKPNRLFSLFKIFVLQKTDIKKVVQKRLMEYDWLWKVLVYGSYLDFNFTRSLKERKLSIKKRIATKKYLCGQGLQYGQDKNPTNGLTRLPFIESNLIAPFFINIKNAKTFGHSHVHRVRNKLLYEKNKLLIKKGVNNKLNVISAISYTNGVFKDALTAIKVFNGNDIYDLRIFSGLFASKLFSYFILQTGSSIGIEREQVHGKDKFSFPYVENIKIAKKVKQIEDITKRLYEEKQKLINQLNEEIFKSFDLDKQELALIDYAINITIPLIMRHDGYERNLFSPIPFENNLLEEYIKVFLSRFAASFREKHLKAEIWHSDSIVGIFFKVISNHSSEQHMIKWHKKKNEKLLNKIVSLGTEKITENLFIQKDIRGFEKTGFYIIKPNERKLWHKAIGYLDVDEFMDAILNAGKESYHG